jgi:hypothetical protein
MTAPAHSVWPICNGCGAEIIGVQPEIQPWSIIVRDPLGKQSEGGAFCLPCMIVLAKHGVLLHPVKREPQRASNTTWKAAKHPGECYGAPSETRHWCNHPSHWQSL